MLPDIPDAIGRIRDIFTNAPGWAKNIGAATLRRAIVVFDSGSKRIQLHKARIDGVEGVKSVLLKEAQALSSAYKKLGDKLADCDEEEFVELRQRMEYVGGELRRVRVGLGALERLAVDGGSEDSKQSDPDKAIPDTWLDRFDEYAKRANEPWRIELLERALALMASKPDSLSTQALWLIGTISSEAFDAFAFLLDHCIYVDKAGFVPFTVNMNEGIQYRDGVLSLGQVMYRLQGLGLVSPDTSSYLKPNTRAIVTYGSRSVSITAASQTTITGHAPTILGYQIAELYQIKHIERVDQCFDAFIADLKLKGATVIE